MKFGVLGRAWEDRFQGSDGGTGGKHGVRFEPTILSLQIWVVPPSLLPGGNTMVLGVFWSVYAESQPHGGRYTPRGVSHISGRLTGCGMQAQWHPLSIPLTRTFQMLA